MRSKSLCLLASILTSGSFAVGQPVRRWAIVAANSPTSVAIGEARLTDELTAKLTGLPGVAIMDRASIDKILREQNFQNMDRSSAETAARIGKLAGVGQMVLVQVYDASYSTHIEQADKRTQRQIGTLSLRANARMIDVETGVILMQPSSTFQDSATISETSVRIPFPPIRGYPPQTTTTGGDPKVIAENLWAKGVNTVAKELADKLASAAPTVSAVKSPAPLVAGIRDGAVYINQGVAQGIKTGDRFQVMREVDLGMIDPATNKPMVRKQRVCTLTISDVDEALASGKCEGGGLPQSKDVAEPLRQ